MGALSYFGLPSSSLGDVEQWAPLLERITAVERGESGREYEVQNELLVNAFKCGFSRKLTLLRGDIDTILLKDVDAYGTRPVWPYDLVSLDYSGGLFYKDDKGRPYRLEAINQVFRRQAASGAQEFVFFLSFNLDDVDQHEVQSTLVTMHRDLKRFGYAADEVIDRYRKHPKEQARLKVYVLHLVNQLAAQQRFDVESDCPIFYSGNRGTEMMAFRFHLKRSSRTFAPASPKERLNQIVNRRMIQVAKGKQTFTNLGLPMIRPPNEESQRKQAPS